jgi:hypothetical protein
MHRLYFVIGASGAGKTAAVRLIAARRPDIVCRYFDTVGVPSDDEMARQHGSGEEWQRQSTIAWVSRIRHEWLGDAPVVLDGQTRPSFIADACVAAGLGDYRIVLFHCEDAVRERRLIARGQPGLANRKMAAWAAYLREQVVLRHDTIIDTTALTVADAAGELERVLSASSS